MGKVLVTGATGNVGSYVAKYLIDAGEDVVLAMRNPDAKRATYGTQASCIGFDFTDSSTFSSSLENVDRVFVVRPPHLGKASDLQPFINAMKEKGGIRLVSFLSLIGIEKNPIPPITK